jgi:REP element-mobilizing transposase RayT
MKASLGPRASRPHRGWHERGYLPHFDDGAVVQSIAFRLGDSLPRHVCERILSTSKSDEDRFVRLDGLADQGRGACLLRQPEVAQIVENALLFFDGERYRLLAWAIMPNHVHVMVEQIGGFPLGGVVHSWKSFTAKEINKFQRSSGPVWAPDYHDRFIRNADHYERALQYIEQNPVKAGLVSLAQDWPYSSARAHAEERAGRPRSQ